MVARRRRPAPPARSALPLVLIAALTAALAATFASPATSTAVCSTPTSPADALEQAAVVFVGTVTTVADQGYTATFSVEEIWKGPNLALVTTVYGGSVGLEDSRSWQVGQRYLVFPSVDADGNLLDSLCSATAPYQTSFDALRPANARPPQGPPTSGPPGNPPIAAVFLGILLLGCLGAFLLWRTGRTGSSP
jgi:hypothetical protein